jgi:SAM-dependent methyltransferase
LAVTETNSLLVWEQAEMKRSSYEASRVAPAIRATTPRTLKRYTAASADTAYPLEYAFHLVGDARGLNVLDLGCGTGANSSILAARGARVTSMDISPDLLQLAARRVALDGHARAVTPVCGSAHAVPVPDASMDLVFGAAILHHLDLELTAREVLRVLKPGGRAIFMEPTRNSRLLAFLRRLIPYQAPDVSPFERPLRHDEIAAFASGFIRRSSRAFRLPLLPLLRLALPKRHEQRIFDWDRALLRRFPSLGHVATVLVFELQKSE